MSELEKVRSFIHENHMVHKNDSVIVGLSGGADSVCLIDILHRLKDEIGFDLTAVHVNHGIRGEEAVRDMKFAQSVCRERNIPCLCVSYDIPAFAKKNKLSEEEAGRMKRYETFEQVRSDLIQRKKEVEDTDAVEGSVKIAVAHNSDDSVETFLHNLCRGSSLSGIVGIKAVNGNLIRPILCLAREEIEKYLSDNQIHYMNDSTNFNLDYTRNRIRNKLIPFLRENINEKSKEHIMQTAKDIYEADQYIDGQAQRLYQAIFMEEEHCIYADKREILQAQSILQKRIVRMAMIQIAGNKKDITRRHIEDVIELCSKQSGRMITLPYGMIAKNEGSRLILEKKSEKKTEKEMIRTVQGSTIGKEEITIDLSLPGEYQYGKYRISIALIDVEKEKINIKILKNNLKNNEKIYTKWFDCDKICNTVQIRTRKTGDYITVNSDGGTKKLKSYYINEKIPASERDSIVCVADGHHIMWVTGYRISEHYKITDETKKIIRITICEKDEPV